MSSSSMVLEQIAEYFELDERILVIQNLDEPDSIGLNCEIWATMNQTDSFNIIDDGDLQLLFNLFAIDNYFNAIIIIDHNMIFRYYDCDANDSEHLIDVINNILFELENAVGDLNNDGGLNIQDIILLVNIILNQEENIQADINADSSINIQDIIVLINIILN